MATEYPDITDWNNLNKYADLFKTSESGDKGQLLDGDPSFVTNDEALDQEPGPRLQGRLRRQRGRAHRGVPQGRAEQDAAPRLLLLAAVVPQRGPARQGRTCRRTRPAATPIPTKITCDYPPYNLNKIISKNLDDKAPKAAQFIKNFTWTAEDQNKVAELHHQRRHDPRGRRRKKWVKANEATWKAWIPAS